MSPKEQTKPLVPETPSQHTEDGGKEKKTGAGADADPCKAGAWLNAKGDFGTEPFDKNHVKIYTCADDGTCKGGDKACAALRNQQRILGAKGLSINGRRYSYSKSNEIKVT